MGDKVSASFDLQRCFRTDTNDQRDLHQENGDDGHFQRRDSQFRNFISKDPGAKFAPERNRYVLYVNYGCPWVL